MLDYLLRFCQIKTLKLMVFLLPLCFLSCAKYRVKLDSVKAKPVWLRTEDKFSFKGRDGDYIPHPFFDLTPFSSKSDNSINFATVTPSGSEFSYRLDLLSGRTYRRHKNCKQTDIWSNYSGKLNLPNFTMGVVPRLLDQLGMPQNIIVFGRDNYYRDDRIRDSGTSNRVRVVGGVVEQYCRNYPCQTLVEWSSRLILVAVDTNDSKFTKISDFKSLKKEVDWEYTKAFIENNQGRFIIGHDEYPSYRLVGEINAEKALAFAMKKGHLFKFKELKGLRSSCYKLYDYLWALVLKSKKSKSRGRDFISYFRKFHDTYGDRFKTCSRYVRYSNINHDPERHWFFAYVDGLFKLEGLGYFYQCSRRSWFRDKNWKAGAKRRYSRCTTYELDSAFDLIKTIMRDQFKSNIPHYRYIGYDEGVGGGHHKMYSWVRSNGKRLSCIDRKSEVDVRRRDYFFPADIMFKKFDPDYRKNRYQLIE